MKKEKAGIPMGISAKLTLSGTAKFRATMSHFKAKYGASFTVADFVELCGGLPINILEPEVAKYMSEKNKKGDLAERVVGVSDEIRARIEAILAEEANGKA